MTASTTAIKYEPSWEPPEELDFAVNAKFARRVESFHEGLKSISLKCGWTAEDGQQYSENIQKFAIKGGGKNKKPGISPEDLTQVIWARADETALKNEIQGHFQATFYGDSDEHDGPFQKMGSFRIDHRKEPEEKGSDVQPVRRGEGVQVLGTAPHGFGSTEDKVVTMMRIQAEQGAGMFAELRASMSQQRIEMCSMMQQHSDNTSQLVREATGFIGELRHELKASREEASKANLRVVKSSENNTLHFQNQQEANRQGWEAFHAGMQMQLQAMQQSMSWERQMMFMQFENLAKDKSSENRRGWIKEVGPLAIVALGQLLTAKGIPQGDLVTKIGMDQMADDEEEEEEDDDTPSPITFPQAPGPQPPYTPPTPPGQPAQPQPAAQPTQPTAQATGQPQGEAPAGSPPEQPKPPPPTVMGVPPGIDPGEHFDKNPLIGMLQLLKAKLTEEQLGKLKELLPMQGWNALQNALKQQKDTLAKGWLMQFIAVIKTTNGLDDALKNELTEEQFELFQDIGHLVAKGLPGQKTKPRARPTPRPVIDVNSTPKDSTPSDEPPAPPPAPPSAPPSPPQAPVTGQEAESSDSEKNAEDDTTLPPFDPNDSIPKLRQYAKDHLGLEFPAKMTKPKILKALRAELKKRR